MNYRSLKFRPYCSTGIMEWIVQQQYDSPCARTAELCPWFFEVVLVHPWYHLRPGVLCAGLTYLVVLVVDVVGPRKGERPLGRAQRHTFFSVWWTGSLPDCYSPVQTATRT